MLPAPARPLAIAMLLGGALSGCHRKVDDPTAVTGQEQRQLDDAAATLDANGAASADNTEEPR